MFERQVADGSSQAERRGSKVGVDCVELIACRTIAQSRSSFASRPETVEGGFYDVGVVWRLV